MLDSQSRLPAPNGPSGGASAWPSAWEEATFTGPMRSPFADSSARSSQHPEPDDDLDVSLEESALFEGPAPPPARPSRLPPPRFDEEATSRHAPPPDLLDALRYERDSVRLQQAVRAAAPLDLSKTLEEPTLGAEISLAEVSTVRRTR